MIYENYDILQKEQERYKELKNRIFSQVNNNKKKPLTNSINDEKNKLIEKNSNEECKLFKPAGDPIKEKVLQNFFKKEEYLRNKKLIPYNINLGIDKYLKNNNNITKFSIPSIGLQQYKNKYLPTEEQYLKELYNQILNKQQKEENEKKKEKSLYNNSDKNMIISNNEYISKKLIIDKEKKKEFLKENQKLIEMKREQKLLDKSSDIALEQKRLKLVEDQEKKELENKKIKKYRIRKELMEKLDEQIRLKRNKSLDMIHIKKNNNNEIKIFNEAKNSEQFKRSLKFNKLLGKTQIYDNNGIKFIKENKQEI